jgi:alanine racemase
MKPAERSWVEISLGAVEENYRAVTALVGSAVTVAPVVKADAYRHGAAEVAKVLERAGAEWFCVSSAAEGLALREAGVGARILVMADFPEVAALGLTPVVHSVEGIARVPAGAPYHLKIDTGLGRLGTRAPLVEILDAIRRAHPPEGLMTHFASSADFIGTQTTEQLAAFREMLGGLRRAGIEPRYVHASATIPVAYGLREAWGNFVRPGMAIYGYVSPARGDAPELKLRVRPALTWKAAILEVKDVPKGARIGYGGTFVAPRAMRIGVLAAGYADGLPHHWRRPGRVIAGGGWSPILGAVSMDLTTIDLSNAPALGPGDSVTILGREGEIEQNAQQLARDAGTISYSLLCGIHARVRRRYVE